MFKSLAYKALDLWTGGRGVQRTISGEVVRFPARWSRFYPSDYEPEKFAFLRVRCQKGHTVLDIGAHIGLFSVLMARRVGETGRVYSFEPTPYTRDVLLQTLRLNGCAYIVEVREEAVAGRTGNAILYDTGDVISNANSLVRTGLSRKEIPVKTISVDDFADSHGLRIDVLKIDAEGAELEILRGAMKTLSACRPAVELELHGDVLGRSGGSCAELWDLLEACRMAVMHADEAVDRNWFCRQRDPVELQILPAR